MRGTAAGLALAAALVPLLASAQEGAGTANVTLGDGSVVPLLEWSLSYECGTWPQGTPPFRAAISQRGARELLLGKKSYPLAGATLEVVYGPAERERDVDGKTQRVKVRVATGFTLVARDGKRTPLRLEPPQRELLLPELDKNTLAQVRTLDLRGQTLSGTKSSLCLVSFTSLVECPDDPGQQVLKVEFQ